MDQLQLQLDVGFRAELRANFKSSINLSDEKRVELLGGPQLLTSLREILRKIKFLGGFTPTYLNRLYCDDVFDNWIFQKLEKVLQKYHSSITDKSMFMMLPDLIQFCDDLDVFLKFYKPSKDSHSILYYCCHTYLIMIAPFVPDTANLLFQWLTNSSGSAISMCVPKKIWHYNESFIEMVHDAIEIMLLLEHQKQTELIFIWHDDTCRMQRLREMDSRLTCNSVVWAKYNEVHFETRSGFKVAMTDNGYDLQTELAIISRFIENMRTGAGLTPRQYVEIYFKIDASLADCRDTTRISSVNTILKEVPNLKSFKLGIPVFYQDIIFIKGIRVVFLFSEIYRQHPDIQKENDD